jgi:hypothetical protein
MVKLDESEGRLCLVGVGILVKRKMQLPADLFSKSQRVT